jgi:hypothetical protein
VGVASASLAPSAGQAGVSVIGTVTADGYTFTNFDYSPLTPPAVGSNVNGISNTGRVVGTTVDVNAAPAFTNFAGTAAGLTQLNAGAGQTAFGINSSGDVVGGNGTNAFFLPNGGAPQTLTVPPGATTAFGINDKGAIVGQFTSGNETPGFYLSSSASGSFVRINAPSSSGADVVNAQGVNNNGLIVGFYLGNDGQTHGFTANSAAAVGSVLSGTAVADPTIPTNPGEPGATFVFSQILGVNDDGLAVGYYGDSTTSQHGFLYNTGTGAYTFLDDPFAAFHNGVEATQITGISDSGEIAGFYFDASGIAHGFTAVPVPEPSTWAMMLAGFSGLCLVGYWASRKQAGAWGNGITVANADRSARR